MKICDLTQFYSPVSGGVRRYLAEKVSFLREHSPTDSHLLIIPGEQDSTVDGERSRIVTVKSPLISRTARYRALLRLDVVERILERERPDVIECGDPYQVAWKAIHSGAALGIPVIGFYHSHFPEAYLRSAQKFLGRIATEYFLDLARRYVRSLYSRFARTVVPSPGLASVLEGWNVINLFVTDLGVDTRVFFPQILDRAAARASIGLPPRGALLLYVGRLAPEKNTRTLFAAFQELRARTGLAYHLLVVGDGQERAPLARLTEELGGNPALCLQPQNDPEEITPLAIGLSWLRFCSDSARLAQLYRLADLFVHPGVLETFGLVTLEAQACGTPVVGIRGSYMDRIIHSGAAHWAGENTPAALARAIAETVALQRDHDPLALGRQIASRYAWTTVFSGLFDLYRTVVNTHARP